MKAIVYTEYGSPDVLHLDDVEKPTPKDNEILIKVFATPVNYGDITARNFANIPAREFNMPTPLWFPSLLAFGIRKPKNPILGSELSGEVVAFGKDVTKFKKGDQVFAYTGMKMGANAEYICVPENGTVGLKPENMSYEEAAAVPYGGIMALSLLRKANIQPGQKVLINGASGGIGALAVQLAKHFGAQVTGICGTARQEYVKALGSDKVIDYTQEDFTQNGETYDLIFDILGRSSFSRCKGSLTENGIYLLASFKMDKVFQMLRTSIFGNKKVICALASEKQEDMVLLKELVEQGKINTIIDRTFPLEQAAEAHRYFEQGQKKGHVIISVGSY